MPSKSKKSKLVLSNDAYLAESKLIMDDVERAVAALDEEALKDLAALSRGPMYGIVHKLKFVGVDFYKFFDAICDLEEGRLISFRNKDEMDLYRAQYMAAGEQ